MKKCNCEPFQSCLCKPGKKEKRGKTKQEENHLNWVASQGCCICGKPANVHHIRELGEPKDHFKTIPLCHDHHQGKNGIHDGLGKKAWREKYGHENEYLKDINKRSPFIEEKENEGQN